MSIWNGIDDKKYKLMIGVALTAIIDLLVILIRAISHNKTAQYWEEARKARENFWKALTS